MNCIEAAIGIIINKKKKYMSLEENIKKIYGSFQVERLKNMRT